MSNLNDPVDKCEGGDVFSIIAMQIEGMIVRTGEGLVNDAVIKPINGILNAMFMPGLDEVCFEHEPSNKFCPNPDDILGSLVECNFDKANAKPHEGCYFEYGLHYRIRTPLVEDHTPMYAQAPEGHLHARVGRRDALQGALQDGVDGRDGEPVPRHRRRRVRECSVCHYSNSLCAILNHFSLLRRPAMLAAFREADRQAKAKTSYDSGVPMQQAEVDKICDSTIMDSLTLDEARALVPDARTAR